MKVACFSIIFLLVSGLVNAISPDVHDASSSIPSSLVKRIQGFLLKAGGIWDTDKTDARGTMQQIDTYHRMRVHAGIKEDISRGVRMGTKEDMLENKVCMTHEQCEKKKVICIKKCGKARGGINKMHYSKCVVKCSKKCFPTC